MFSLLQGLYMVRFHSLYPWHHHNDYQHLTNEKDSAMLPWVQKFRLVIVAEGFRGGTGLGTQLGTQLGREGLKIR